jgi:hypothetical protein
MAGPTAGVVLPRGRGCRRHAGGAFQYLRPVDSLELIQAGEHVVLGVRGERLDAIDDEPLGGQIFNVFTLQGGKITRIDDHRHRAEALAAAGAAEPEWH